MLQVARLFLRVAAVAVPIGLGVVAISNADALKPPPAVRDMAPRAMPVRVITLAELPTRPRLVGHGTVAPARQWRGVARVEGEIVMTAPRLAPGELLAAGTELLRIDDTDIRLSLAQIDAQLAALRIRDETLQASLDIGRADLDLSRAELDRQGTLADQGVATRTALDQARRQELAARAKVVEIENQLSLNTAERAVLEAQRALAARSLEFTTLRAPYDLRLTDVSAELGQVVTRGQVMLTAEGTEAVEIAAQFAIGKIGPLVRLLPAGAKVTDLQAAVRLPVEDHAARWDATLVRVGEAIDPATQSTALVVRVEDPLGQAAPGAKPPLRRNTFVEVVLSAPPRAALVVPLEAVQGGKALVVSDDDTLQRREVSLDYVMEGIALVSGGLSPGDRLVVTDPAIAVPGMAVKPVEDAATLARIAAQASGKPAGRAQDSDGQAMGQGKGKGQ